MGLGLRGLIALHFGTGCPEIQERSVFADAVGGALIRVVEYGLEEGLLRLHKQVPVEGLMSCIGWDLGR